MDDNLNFLSRCDNRHEFNGCYFNVVWSLKKDEKMDNFKQKWVDALRSGKYEQGRGFLKTEDGKFCCLGVACDIVDPDGWNVQVGNISFKEGYRGWAPETIVHTQNISQMKLAGMNDNGKTFLEIADFIEENYQE